MSTKEKSKTSGHNVVQVRRPPEKQSCAAYLYNSETKEVLGRTALGWLKLIVFYAIYYTCLALFFAAMYSIFQLGVSTDVPKYFNTEGLMMDSGKQGPNPGVGFRPLDRDNVTTLVAYHRDDAATSRPYREMLKKFIGEYTEADAQCADKATEDQTRPDHCDNAVAADDESGPLTSVSYRAFDLQKALGVCDTTHNYGYVGGEGPCIMLKLNRIFGWTPDPYNCTTKDECVKEGMNEEDYDHLSGEVRVLMSPNKAPEEFVKSLFDGGRTVPITCSGIYPNDRENLRGLQYQTLGIDAGFYPYLKQPGYRQPFVAVKVVTTPGVLVMVQCRAWARNIRHDFVTRDGSVHFEILVD